MHIPHILQWLALTSAKLVAITGLARHGPRLPIKQSNITRGCQRDKDKQLPCESTRADTLELYIVPVAKLKQYRKNTSACYFVHLLLCMLYYIMEFNAIITH